MVTDQRDAVKYNNSLVNWQQTKRSR